MFEHEPISRFLNMCVLLLFKLRAQCLFFRAWFPLSPICSYVVRSESLCPDLSSNHVE